MTCSDYGGDYGWSMDFGTSQGSVAVEYGRVLEYPKKRNKISDHEKARFLQINHVRIGKHLNLPVHSHKPAIATAHDVYKFFVEAP